MLNGNRLEGLFLLGGLASLFFFLVGSVSIIHTSTVPSVQFEPVSISIGAASLFLSIVSGSATFASWMNNAKNRFAANLIFKTFNECGPVITEESLGDFTKSVFEGIQKAIKEADRSVFYNLSHWRELRQQLGEFDEKLFENAK